MESNGNITGLPPAPLYNLKEVIEAACWHLDPVFAQSQYLGPVVANLKPFDLRSLNIIHIRNDVIELSSPKQDVFCSNPDVVS